MLRAKSDWPQQLPVFLAAVILGAIVLLLDRESWLVAILVGIAIAGYGGYRLYRGVESKEWSKTSGTIQAVSVGEYTVAESEYSRSTYYFPEIQFAYVVNGSTYRGNRAAIDIKSIWSPDKKKADELMKQYAPGSTVAVYFQSSKPEDSVMFPGLSSYRVSHYVAMLVGGLLVAGVGYVVHILQKNA